MKPPVLAMYAIKRNKIFTGQCAVLGPFQNFFKIMKYGK
jgi:hypothetical protein